MLYTMRRTDAELETLSICEYDQLGASPLKRMASMFASLASKGRIIRCYCLILDTRLRFNALPKCRKIVPINVAHHTEGKMHHIIKVFALGGLAFHQLTSAVSVGKATIAVHGSGINKEPFTQEVHSLVERAPVSNKAPNITDRAWINGILSRVDLWREKHAAAPLVWSTTLAQYALDAANKCVLAHTGGPYVSLAQVSFCCSGIKLLARVRTYTGSRRPRSTSTRK